MADRINEAELIKRVATRTGHEQQVVEEIIEATLDEIYQSMKQVERVSLRNFGTFYIDEKHSHNRKMSTVFKFNPSQKWRKLFGWSSTYKGEL